MKGEMESLFRVQLFRVSARELDYASFENQIATTSEKYTFRIREIQFIETDKSNPPIMRTSKIRSAIATTPEKYIFRI